MAHKENGTTARILMGVSLGFHFVWFSFTATCLAMLAVIIGIAAIGGFILVRREAIGAAEDVAKAQIPLVYYAQHNLWKF
jgi:uncharacterized YccA/Bax inhibitor family protein